MYLLRELSYSGLCIIPIETGLLRTGFVNNIINLSYLDGIIELSDRRNLYVKYLSNSKGLVDYDTYIDYERSRTGSVIYHKIVAEQVYRECIDKSVSKVYFMGRKHDKVSLDLINSVKGYGIEVITPIMGISVKAIPNALLFYR